MIGDYFIWLIGSRMKGRDECDDLPLIWHKILFVKSKPVPLLVLRKQWAPFQNKRTAPPKSFYSR